MIGCAGFLPALVLACCPADTTLVDRARVGTAKYRDVAVALADGYRPIGPDAPGMGRHYVNPVLVMGGQVIPGRPQALSYARVGDAVVLVAVAWVVPVTTGQAPPATEGTEGFWHVHRGSVMEEGNLFGHEMRPADHVTGTGVAMLHAWVSLANDAGPYAPDNWRLPFFRHGLTTPRTPTAAEAKALGLADDTEGFYAAQFGHHGRSSARITDTLERHARVIREWLDTRSVGAMLTEADLAWLAGRWNRILQETEP